MVIYTGVAEDLQPRTYDTMVQQLKEYDHPAVNVRTIDSYLSDPSLVSDEGRQISYVDISYCDNPDSSIVITSGRHATEHGGADAAMELVDRIVSSPEMQAYLQHGQVTIVPAVNVDEYVKEAPRRRDTSNRVDADHPFPGMYKGYDGNRNIGHDQLISGSEAPDYEGRLSFFDQFFTENEKGASFRDTYVVPKETYAVAKLLEKKAEEGDVLFTADLHETVRPYASFTTVTYKDSLDDAATAMKEAVGTRYATQDIRHSDGAMSFSGYSEAMGIDGYTTEGGPFDGERQLKPAQRVEQQLLALDALLAHYVAE